MDKNWIKQVKTMSEEEWNNFRNTKWLNVRKQIMKHTLPPPSWFLPSKQNYVNFCEAKTTHDKATALINANDNSRQSDLHKWFEILERPEQEISKRLFVSSNESHEDWEEYRRFQWKKWSGNDKFSEPPANFLKDQKKYDECLKEIRSLEVDLSFAKADVTLTRMRQQDIEEKLNELKKACYFDRKEVKEIDTSASQKLLTEHYEKIKTQKTFVNKNQTNQETSDVSIKQTEKQKQ